MGKIALLAPWLQKIFPPAETPGLQPLETGNDISYVHQVFSGSDDLGEAEESATLSAAGGTRIQLIGSVDDFYTVIHAADASHSDPVGRNLTFELQRTTVNIRIQPAQSATTNNRIPFLRTYIIPPGWAFGVSLNAIDAAEFLTGTVCFTRVPTGHPHQHF